LVIQLLRARARSRYESTRPDHPFQTLTDTNFFTVEVQTWRGLVTYYVLSFLHLETPRVTLAGITGHPTEAWITQMARNAVDDTCRDVRQCRYVLHDRDTKVCRAFDEVLASEGTRF
jgi:hypothetical protein